MSRSILKATINHNDENRRITIRLVRNPDGSLGWYGPDGSCDLTSQSRFQAKKDAVAAWGADVWDLRATWLPR